MKTLSRQRLPAWPRNLPRHWVKVADLINTPRENAVELMNSLGFERARMLRREREEASGITQTYMESFFVGQNYTAVANVSAETSLLSGTNLQPDIAPGVFKQGGRGGGRTITCLARGVLSTTSTPTALFQWRLGTTSGSSFLSGTSVGVSVAITTSSAVTNQYWESRIDLICTTPGTGGGNCTLQASGYVLSPGGFASPFTYPLLPTTPPTGTWTATIDDSVTQWVNLSMTWGTANASNTITCKSLRAYCEN